MKKPTKLIISVLVVAFAAGILAGCGGTDEAGSTPGSADSGTRTIIDSLGREVEIPATVEKIVPLGNTPRMITYLGLADKVVGIGGMNRDSITPVTAYAYATETDGPMSPRLVPMQPAPLITIRNKSSACSQM
jgi:iron complex transport system substrate-binding protein